MLQSIHRIRSSWSPPLAAVAALLAACSSSSSTPGSGSGTPQAVTIAAGDGQTTQPGTALPVHPAVIVKDASGQPVAGVTVTFAVDSGGGSLSITSVTTGANGVATAGSWTLGSAEGRNTLRVTVGSLAPLKIVATATIVAATLPTTTIGTGGGSVTVTDPGPLNGFNLAIPAGAFAGAVQVTVSYASSSALPHVSGVTVGSPIVTIASNATGPANHVFTLRIPARIAAGQFPIVAMVDPVLGFLEALPTASFDSTGVTAVGTMLDGTQVLETLRGGVGGGRAALSNQQIQYAIMLADSSLLHTVSIDTHFLPGVDDWEFPSQPTQVFESTSPGAVVSERYYFLKQKSQASGSLWERFEKTHGVPVSDAAGIQWSAALSKQFDGMMTPYIVKAMAARTANQVLYDRNTIKMVAASMIASGGAPQIVAFYNVSAGTYSPMLAYRWDGPSGTLYTADPDYPGDANRYAIWNSNGLGCTNVCLAIVGLNHLIGYLSQLNAEFPSVVDGTIDKTQFPDAYATSYDSIIGPKGVIDTLFMVRDTTRIWIECPACAGSFPTTIPLHRGASGIETQQIYLQDPSGGWSENGGQTQTGFFIDLAQFPSLSSNEFADFQFGIEALGLLTPAIGSLSTTGWLGWKQYRVIKFAPTLTYTPAISGIKKAIAGLPTTFAVSTNGGPALPQGLSYLFKWGDGTADTRVSTLPASMTHTFPIAGTSPVVMEIHHTNNDQTVASTSLPDTVVNGPVWQVDLATRTSSSVPPLLNHADSSQQFSAEIIFGRLVATPSSTLLVGTVSPTCSSAIVEHFPASIPVVYTGLAANTSTIIAAVNCPGYAGTFTMGPFGNGVLTGSGPNGAIVTGFGNLIAGGSGAINSVMAGKALSGTLTLSIYYSAGVGVYTFQFHAVLVQP